MATADDINHEETCLWNTIFNFDALKKLGYEKRFSEKRVQMYKITSDSCTEIIRQRTHEDIDVVVAGSRGEGICISGDSDADILFIQRNVRCTERIQAPLQFDKTIPVLFQLEFENVPNGYAKLRLIALDNCYDDFKFLTKIKENLVQSDDQKYLRNDKSLITVFGHKRHGWAKQQSVFDDISGPARTIRIEMSMLPELHLSVDCVFALKCEYPFVVDDWCKRERKHCWPSKDLIETVKKLDVLVVPAGYKGSVDEELQWRISLTLAEQALVHSFNDIQIKLYAALKMLAKHELKPICESITSYIVKNLIFWTFENTEINSITKDTFDDTLLQILEHLKIRITWKYLPSYMIPSNNMLQYKIFETEKENLIQRLNLIINDGCHALIRCPMVKHISYLSSDVIEEMNAFREFLEQGFVAAVWTGTTNPDLTVKIWDIERRPMDVFKTVEEVFPIIRLYNSHGLFDRLYSHSKENMLLCLLNGIIRGYHKSNH